MQNKHKNVCTVHFWKSGCVKNAENMILQFLGPKMIKIDNNEKVRYQGKSTVEETFYHISQKLGGKKLQNANNRKLGGREKTQAEMHLHSLMLMSNYSLGEARGCLFGTQSDDNVSEG